MTKCLIIYQEMRGHNREDKGLDGYCIYKIMMFSLIPFVQGWDENTEILYHLN